ncbi:MAG: site-specific DNA-methyltransferase, partial [Pseudolabrys sp.]
LQAAPLDDKAPDPVVDWIRMVSINRLTGHSPGFFSGRTMPPTQAVGVEAQRKINEREGRQPPPRNVIDLILKKSRSLLSDGYPPQQQQPAQFYVRPAHDTPDIRDHSVALVVTSPPFLDTVQYADDNWLRCWFAGIDLSRIEIAMHRTQEAWTAFVRGTLRELARVLKPGGYLAFEVGEVRGGKVLLERLVWQAAEGLPFERQGVIVNQQEFTKTANCWGVSNNAKGTNTNRIVVLRRNGA